VGLFNLFRRAAPKPKARRGRGPKSADELAKLDERNDRRLYFRRNPAAQDVYIRKQLGIEDDRDPVVRAQRAAEQAIKEAEAAGHQAAARYIAEDPDIGRVIALKLVDARTSSRVRSPHDELRDTLALLRELREDANGEGGREEDEGFAGSLQKYVAPLMPALLLGLMARTNPEAAAQMAQAMAGGPGGVPPSGGGGNGQFVPPPARTRALPVPSQPAPAGLNGFQSRPPAGAAGLPDTYEPEPSERVDVDGNILPAGLGPVFSPSPTLPVPRALPASNGVPAPAPAATPSAGGLTPEAMAAVLQRLSSMSPEEAAEALWNLFADAEDAGGTDAERVAELENLLLSAAPDAGVLALFQALALREPVWQPLVAHISAALPWLTAVREQLRAIDGQARAEAGLAASGETGASGTTGAGHAS